MRYVTTKPNREGLIELGPCDSGFALGDTLTITPLAAALGSKAVMCLPEQLEKFAFLFRGLCQVRITENHPFFRWTRGNAAAQKLSMFSFHEKSPLPQINVSLDAIARGKEMLNGMPNPIAFVPTCSRHWDHIRQRPYNFWKPVVAELAQRYTVCQFGLPDYPTVPQARRMPFIDLETLAGVYHTICNYVGVDTGDYHLMIAVGGRCIVAEPEPMPKIQSDYWLFKTDRIIYAKLSHPQTVLDAIKQMGL